MALDGKIQKKKIPLSSPDISQSEEEKVLEVLRTRHLSQGPKIEDFEKSISEYINIPYVIGVNSGTSALHLIVRSLGLKEGDEVITTPFSFIASSNCLLMEKVKPVFVDIDPKTYNLNPSLIEDKINPKTKAILVVHIFGHPADMNPIYEIAEKHGLKVIEDACEAIGAEYHGEKVGRKSDAATFAFYPNKQITTGEGGVIVTSNPKIAELCKSMRNQGRNVNGDWLVYERLGYNYRLDELSAALGVAQMERIEEILEKRKSVAENYLNELADIPEITLPFIAKEVKMSWFTFVIKVDMDKRQKIMEFLHQEGIDCREYFPCIHLEPFYKEMFGYKEGDFPIAEKISKETIALPFHNNLKSEEVDYISVKLKEAIRLLKDV